MFLVCTPSCDILWYIVANEVKKNSNEFVWRQDGSLGAGAPVPLPGYVTSLPMNMTDAVAAAAHTELTQTSQYNSTRKRRSNY